MKSIFTILLFSISTVVFGASLTSTIDGTIIYLPKKGQIIKKGEALVRYSENAIKIQEEINTVEMEIIHAELKELKADFERYRLLHSKAAASLADYEEITSRYVRCRLKLKKLKLEKKDLDRLHKKCITYAPYDCKITKLYVIQNSGVETGDKVLEAEPVSSDTSN